MSSSVHPTFDQVRISDLIKSKNFLFAASLSVIFHLLILFLQFGQSIRVEMAFENSKQSPSILDVTLKRISEIKQERIAKPIKKVVKKSRTKKVVKEETKKIEKVTQQVTATTNTAVKQTKVNDRPVEKQFSETIAEHQKPIYPRVAKLRSIEGDVQILIRVLKSGLVEEVKVLSSSGYDSLDQSAISAAKNWKFKAYLGAFYFVKKTVKFRLED